jgi:small-conductance mechanosensitive channel
MTFHTSIGIKQVIRYEWMNYTVGLLKSGLNREEIRKELEYYLSERKGNGKIGDRAEYTMSLAVTLLMNIWVNPKRELIDFRNRLLEVMKSENSEPVCHWAMISSVYPFWFNMSFIIGSLFRLQDQIKKNQIMSRIYEILGERNTIERCSRYVIRSFVSWDIIRDKKKAGYYEMGKIISISDIYLTSLFLETMLNAIPENRIPLTSILTCPAFFSFKLPSIEGSQLAKANKNLCVERFSVTDEFIKLKR